MGTYSQPCAQVSWRHASCRCARALVTQAWGIAATSRSRQKSGCRSQTTGRGMMTKRNENDRGQRSHGVLKILVAFLAIVAMLGPTVLVVSDAWAKGGSAGSGSG